MKIFTLITGFVLCQALACFAQSSVILPASESLESDYPSFVYNIDETQLKDVLATAPMQGEQVKGQACEMQLPDQSGRMLQLQVVESPIIAPELAMKYPEIKTYKVSGAGVTGRIGYTYKGFHGILFTTHGTLYIDPVGSSGTYHTYHRGDYMAHVKDKGHRCLVEEQSLAQAVESAHQNRGGRTGDQLRTYRLALACTGEYAQFHGGTITGALSAMVVTMNRVNGVYERDFAVSMEIIADNDEIIFLDSSTDPYSNNSGFLMLGENQQCIDSIIGNSNYDIGHVFSTGGGGIASLQSVCSFSNKARGVTGGGSPIGDPFDIDYVAHEMGHQFGGNHTQNNSCNRNGATAWEPGSASTIMGYAGICAPNLQNNSDDYFHSGNYDEITSHVNFTVNAQACPTVTNTGNSAPTVSVDPNFYVLPKETPFVLRGSATDINGDDLSYCWEQMDLGPSGSPTNPSGNAPIFRSWDPVDHGERIFPRLLDVITNSTTIGETYATYSRDLNFRLTVRDNHVNGGGVAYDEVAMAVDGNKGPFEVLTPTASEQVQTQTLYEVKWDVANTDQSPINCQAVHILYYANNGLTFVDTLAAAVPNTGSYFVEFPAVTGPGYRVWVEAADNVFFNINPGVFTLVDPQAPAGADITLAATPDFTNGTVDLAWNDDFTNESFWVIERSVGGNSGFTILDSVGVNDTTYQDSSVSMLGTAYHYRVYAGNAYGNSAYSNEANWSGLGINDMAGASWAVYPNPTHQVLTIHPSAGANAADLVVYDEAGRRVWHHPARAAEKVSIDVTNWLSGTYFLHVRDDAGAHAVKTISVSH